MRPGLHEQRPRLVEPALAGTQLAEPGDPARGHRRPRALEVADGGGQLDLGGGPVAVRREHVAVGAAADPDELADAPAIRVRPHGLAPLCGAREVADALAGRDQVAQRPAARERQPQVLAARDHGRLVEQAHAGLDAPAPHVRDALQPEADRLEVGQSERAAERGGAQRQRAGPVEVAADVHRVRALVKREPAVVLALRGDVVEQPVGALEPAARDRVVAPELEVVGRPARPPRGRRRRRRPRRGMRGRRARARPT